MGQKPWRNGDGSFELTAKRICGIYICSDHPVEISFAFDQKLTAKAGLVERFEPLLVVWNWAMPTQS